jgi:hypothetical protein
MACGFSVIVARGVSGESLPEFTPTSAVTSETDSNPHVNAAKKRESERVRGI